MCSAARCRSSSSPSARVRSRPWSTSRLAVRLAAALLPASSRARASAAAATCPAGATRLTRPQWRACAASTQPPSSISSLARRAPIRRGSRWLPPPPAISPKLACWSPSRAVSSITTRSATSTSSSPPARARPCTPATTGTGSASMRSNTRCQRRMKAAHRSGSPTVACTARRSAPAQKARPAAVSVTARTSESPSIASHARSRSASSSGEMALSCPGRFSTMRATPSPVA